MALPHGTAISSHALDDRRRWRVSARASLRLLSAASLIGGVLAVVSALTPWWYTSTSTTGTSSRAEFYPGDDIYASGGGGGGYTSYASQGLSSVGELYGSVLVGSVVVAVLGWFVAGAGFGRSVGRWDGPRVRRAARLTLLAGVGMSVLLAVTIPLAQPALYRADDPAGSCLGAAAPGPCTSFWGSAHDATTTRVWGGGLGWSLDVGAAVLLGAALVAGSWTRRTDAEPRDARTERG